MSYPARAEGLVNSTLNDGLLFSFVILFVFADMFFWGGVLFLESFICSCRCLFVVCLFVVFF